MGNNKMRELFARVKAYYVSFIDQKEPATVRDWNVFKLQLPRHKRHQDINVTTIFWADLETFLNREKFKGLQF